MPIEGSLLSSRHDDGDPPDTDSESLFTLRTLVIVALTMVIGLFAGAAAGVPAGMAAATKAGPAVGVVVGLVGGIAAALLGGLTAASVLHALVRRAS